MHVDSHEQVSFQVPSCWLLAVLPHRPQRRTRLVSPLFCLTWVVVQDGHPVDEDIFAAVSTGNKTVSVLNVKPPNVPRHTLGEFRFGSGRRSH